jgi:hypothetical protein
MMDGPPPRKGSPRGNFIPPKDPTGNQNANGTILDFVENWGHFGTSLRDKLRDHATRQITLNSACEQLPVETNRVTLSANNDGLGIARPMIQYRFDNDDYVRNCFKTVIDVHTLIFDQLGATDRVMQPDTPDTVIYGGSGHIMGTTIMGADPKTSVVDKDCRTHDHPKDCLGTSGSAADGAVRVQLRLSARRPRSARPTFLPIGQFGGGEQDHLYIFRHGGHIGAAAGLRTLYVWGGYLGITWLLR